MTPLRGAGHDIGTALRIVRQLVLERLIVLDCDTGAPLALVSGAMTELAEFALDVACRETQRELDTVHGAPLGAQGQRAELWVIGMGKLGARELNVSSDIDLIYVYDQDGETEGVDGGRGRISNHEYFIRAVKMMYGADRRHHRAWLRVPGRLWLCARTAIRGRQRFPLGALEDYFQVQGREWERFAWLKSRVVAPWASVDKRFGAGVARQRAAVRLSPLPRLQRVRFAAGPAQADPRARGQAQRRPARARQRRQALARRHPRDRVHGATAAGGARRPVPRIAHAPHLAGAAARRRGRPDAAGHRRRAGARLRVPAPGRAPHPVPRRPADPCAADVPQSGGRRRPDLDRPDHGLRRLLPVPARTGHPPRAGGAGIRPPARWRHARMQGLRRPAGRRGRRPTWTNCCNSCRRSCANGWRCGSGIRG